MLLLMGFNGCKKKDRLSASTFTFEIVPPSASVVIGTNQTFVISASVPTSPTWTITSSTFASLNTTIGESVILTGNNLGDLTIQAVFDGLMATSQVTIVSAFSPGTSGNFDVYTDNGLPPVTDGFNSDIFTTGSVSSLAEQTDSSEFTPEGFKFQRTVIPNTGGWGVTLHSGGNSLTKDLSASTSLIFFIKLHRAITGSERFEVRIADPANDLANTPGRVTGLPGLVKNTTEWQAITIPVGSFAPAMDMSQILVPYVIEAQNISGGGLTFDIDAIRWE